MKKIFLFLAFAVCAVSLKAQVAQEAKKDVADTTFVAKITFDKLVHDFKEIEFAGDGTCSFKFKNDGVAPLVLSSVKASCGCTTPSWPKDPILPGKESEIKVKYDTKRVGSFSKTITVTSNALTPSVVLKISGVVLPQKTDTTN